MQRRLRPTAAIAADAILVGDPGRSLMLAQALLDEPKMSNHARGLWGYTGPGPGGRPLTIQATGIGGPSAALVLDELYEHGVRRAVRIGSGLAGARGAPAPGGIVVARAAIAAGGSAASFGVAPGGSAAPDPELTAGLEAGLGGAAIGAPIASFDAPPAAGSALPGGAVAADLQTVAVLARGAELGIAVAAALVVVLGPDGPAIEDDERDDAAKAVGSVAAGLLST